MITKIEEVPSELGEPDCKLINPFIVKKSQTGQDSLESWLSEYTDQNTFMIHSDKILTISDPNSNLKGMYTELV